MTSNNISMMNLSSLIDYTVTKKTKFLNLVVVLWFWDFGRSRDQTGSGCSGIHGEFGFTGGWWIPLKKGQ